MFNKPASGSFKEASKQKRVVGYFLENETKYASILSKVSKLCLLKVKSSGLTLVKLTKFIFVTDMILVTVCCDT
jgi:hypothetical protein